MNSLDFLKAKRDRFEEEDLCFFSGEFIKEPRELFHPLIGFVSVSKINEDKLKKVFDFYEDKHKNKDD